MAIMSNLSRAPLVALSAESKHLISTLLNPPRAIPGSNGFLRDWRGLAQICSVKGETMPAIAIDADPFNKILDIIQKSSMDFTLQNLKDALEKLERWDIVDDSESNLVKDADLYVEMLEKCVTAAEENNFEADKEILTFDDQFRIERGEEKQRYDAFLLYADEDMDFVHQVIENLEKKHNLKLCIKERDLIAGITFEHEAIMKLISERCNRLIAIISPDFLKSPANKFFLNFAQASGIDKGQERKIIPCVYKECELPPQLTFFTKVYFNKSSPDFFWDKLVRSMKAVPLVLRAQKTTEAPNEAVTSSGDKINNELKQFCSDKNGNIKENSCGESSKSLSCLLKKQKLKLEKVYNPVEESHSTSDSHPNLPSLGELDSLSTTTTTTTTLVSSKSTTIKSKKKKFIKKVQSLLVKS